MEIFSLFLVEGIIIFSTFKFKHFEYQLILKYQINFMRNICDWNSTSHAYKSESNMKIIPMHSHSRSNAHSNIPIKLSVKSP